MKRRDWPLPPPKGSDIDIESFWGTSVGDPNDVDLDDGPATSFKVPPPKQQDIEILASVIAQSCSKIEARIWALNRTLRLILYMTGAFLFGAVVMITIDVIK